MQVPIGASLQLALLAVEGATEMSVRGLAWLWEQCAGVKRAERRLAKLEQQQLVHISAGADSLARVVRLTEAGRLAALGGRDPVRQWSRTWDGRWRLVLFDVPEREEALRTRLRRRLRALHFGYLQNSVWITPDNLDSLGPTLAGGRANVESLILLDAHPCGGESNQDLVAGAWDFDRLKRMYEAYMELLRSHPSGSLLAPSRRNAWQRWLQREWHAWNGVMRHDPLLPEALLPAGYPGKQAWAQRQQVLRMLPQPPPDLVRA